MSDNSDELGHWGLCNRFPHSVYSSWLLKVEKHSCYSCHMTSAHSWTVVCYNTVFQVMKQWGPSTCGLVVSTEKGCNRTTTRIFWRIWSNFWVFVKPFQGPSLKSLQAPLDPDGWPLQPSGGTTECHLGTQNFLKDNSWRPDVTQGLLKPPQKHAWHHQIPLESLRGHSSIMHHCSIFKDTHNLC